MVEQRACVYICVIFLSFHLVSGKPFFGTQFWCDLLCDDDDGTSTTSSSDEDYYDWFGGDCSGCPTSRPRSTTTPSPAAATTANPSGNNPFNLVIPPSNGMNVTFTNADNGGWLFNFVPWAAPAATPAAAATTAAPAAGSTAAAATTAAPDATTAAADATTAAPTTAAAAK